MAATGGVEFKEVLKKLGTIGEYLQSSTSTLLIEMNVLNKLIYKSKNTHSKEKFFKCLERIKKCLCKWKVLNLDKKVIATSKIVGEMEYLSENLNEIMLGGQLVLRVIILCQETVQYSLAYLSKGFFINLHVTLISLVSRIWVLQKDCWLDLVECYQLVRSLITLTEHNSETNYIICDCETIQVLYNYNLSNFPECLTTWLSDDVEKMFDTRDASGNDPFSTASSTNTILQQFFEEKNAGRGSPIVFTDSVGDDDELDIGEPVGEMREFNDEIFHGATPATVSALKTNLALEFDIEHAARDDCSDSDSFKMDALKAKFGEQKSTEALHVNRCKPDEVRKSKSDNKLRARRHRRSLHCIKNTTFVKKLPSRFTLRSLLATRDYGNFSLKRIHILSKCLTFALHSQVLPGERRILLSTQRWLQRELRKRGNGKNEGRKDEHSCLRKTNDDSLISRKFSTKIEKCGRKISTKVSRKISRKISTKSEKGRISEKKDEQKFERKRLLFRRDLKDCDRSDGFLNVGPIGLKYGTFSNERPGDRKSQSKSRDEIDDIFGSLGL